MGQRDGSQHWLVHNHFMIRYTVAASTIEELWLISDIDVSNPSRRREVLCGGSWIRQLNANTYVRYLHLRLCFDLSLHACLIMSCSFGFYLHLLALNLRGKALPFLGINRLRVSMLETSAIAMAYCSRATEQYP